jgi:hypothetical protein
VSIFDFPVARRTDQFDRLGHLIDLLEFSREMFDDWLGVHVPEIPIFVLSGARMPVHDLPMEY